MKQCRLRNAYEHIESSMFHDYRKNCKDRIERKESHRVGPSEIRARYLAKPTHHGLTGIAECDLKILDFLRQAFGYIGNEEMGDEHIAMCPPSVSVSAESFVGTILCHKITPKPFVQVIAAS